MSARTWRTPIVILSCATLILLLSFGARQTYGLYLAPISKIQGWEIGIFSFAMALQTLKFRQDARFPDETKFGFVVFNGAAWEYPFWLFRCELKFETQKQEFEEERVIPGQIHRETMR